MQFSQYERVPYSFCRENHSNHNFGMEKEANQLQTNEQSDSSQFLEHSHDHTRMKTYSSLVKSLSKQMQFYKSALGTAQNLIGNYQRQLGTIKEENQRLQSQLFKATSRLQNIERLILKLFSCEQKSQTTTKTSFYQKQNLRTFNNVPDDQIQKSVYQKIQHILDQQFRYQEQIFELNRKIKLLERGQNQEYVKKTNKLKSVFVPFASTQVTCDQRTKLTNQIMDVYANQKTVKTITNKHTDFKKNLQKQFQVFLQSKRSTSKARCCMVKTPCNQNNKSLHSISQSTQKKGCCRRSSSVQKR